MMDVAAGRRKASLVLKGGTIVNVFTERTEIGDIAIEDGCIAGIGEYDGLVNVDMTGRYICPGFIDGHIHIESSMVSPPEFEKADRFKMNLVNCAMIGAFVLSMPQRPEVDRLTDYYAKAMMTAPMQWFCRKSGKSKFTEKDIATMKATAALKAADRNPYSWNMEFYEYPDGSGYEGRFTKCGICVLMKELGLYDLTPALCHLDYTMSEAGGVTNFVRQYTLAFGGPYCDCGYKKKQGKA